MPQISIGLHFILHSPPNDATAVSKYVRLYWTMSCHIVFALAISPDCSRAVYSPLPSDPVPEPELPDKKSALQEEDVESLSLTALFCLDEEEEIVKPCSRDLKYSITFSPAREVGLLSIAGYSLLLLATAHRGSVSPYHSILCNGSHVPLGEILWRLRVECPIKHGAWLGLVRSCVIA